MWEKTVENKTGNVEQAQEKFNADDKNFKEVFNKFNEGMVVVENKNFNENAAEYDSLVNKANDDNGNGNVVGNPESDAEQIAAYLGDGVAEEVAKEQVEEETTPIVEDPVDEVAGEQTLVVEEETTPEVVEEQVEEVVAGETTPEVEEAVEDQVFVDETEVVTNESQHKKPINLNKDIFAANVSPNYSTSDANGFKINFEKLSDKDNHFKFYNDDFISFNNDLTEMLKANKGKTKDVIVKDLIAPYCIDVAYNANGEPIYNNEAFNNSVVGLDLETLIKIIKKAEAKTVKEKAKVVTTEGKTNAFKNYDKVLEPLIKIIKNARNEVTKIPNNLTLSCAQSIGTKLADEDKAESFSLYIVDEDAKNKINEKKKNKASDKANTKGKTAEVKAEFTPYTFNKNIENQLVYAKILGKEYNAVNVEKLLKEHNELIKTAEVEANAAAEKQAKATAEKKANEDKTNKNKTQNIIVELTQEAKDELFCKAAGITLKQLESMKKEAHNEVTRMQSYCRIGSAEAEKRVVKIKDGELYVSAPRNMANDATCFFNVKEATKVLRNPKNMDIKDDYQEQIDFDQFKTYFEEFNGIKVKESSLRFTNKNKENNVTSKKSNINSNIFIDKKAKPLDKAVSMIYQASLNNVATHPNESEITHIAALKATQMQMMVCRGIKADARYEVVNNLRKQAELAIASLSSKQLNDPQTLMKIHTRSVEMLEEQLKTEHVQVSKIPQMLFRNGYFIEDSAINNRTTVDVGELFTLPINHIYDLNEEMKTSNELLTNPIEVGNGELITTVGGKYQMITAVLQGNGELPQDINDFNKIRVTGSNAIEYTPFGEIQEYKTSYGKLKDKPIPTDRATLDRYKKITLACLDSLSNRTEPGEYSAKALAFVQWASENGVVDFNKKQQVKLNRILGIEPTTVPLKLSAGNTNNELPTKPTLKQNLLKKIEDYVDTKRATALNKKGQVSVSSAETINKVDPVVVEPTVVDSKTTTLTDQQIIENAQEAIKDIPDLTKIPAGTAYYEQIGQILQSVKNIKGGIKGALEGSGIDENVKKALINNATPKKGTDIADIVNIITKEMADENEENKKTSAKKSKEKAQVGGLTPLEQIAADVDKKKDPVKLKPANKKLTKEIKESLKQKGLKKYNKIGELLGKNFTNFDKVVKEFRGGEIIVATEHDESYKLYKKALESNDLNNMLTVKKKIFGNGKTNSKIQETVNIFDEIRKAKDKGVSASEAEEIIKKINKLSGLEDNQKENVRKLINGSELLSDMNQQKSKDNIKEENEKINRSQEKLDRFINTVANNEAEIDQIKKELEEKGLTTLESATAYFAMQEQIEKQNIVDNTDAATNAKATATAEAAAKANNLNGQTPKTNIATAGTGLSL